MVAREAMRFKASHDALTGLWHRGQIMEMLDRELVRARREDRPLGLFIADVDHFKAVNDHRGHLAGDEVLRETARRLAGSVRPYDAVGRYGGDEFLILVSSCNAASAKKKAEQLRATLAVCPVNTSAGTFPITISVGGVSTELLGQPSAQEILHAADEALYRGKQKGRNRAQIWEPKPAAKTPCDPAVTDNAAADPESYAAPLRRKKLAAFTLLTATLWWDFQRDGGLNAQIFLKGLWRKTH